MTALAIARKDEILNRLASGELLRDISASFNVSPAAISQYLAKDPSYQAAREIGIAQQLERWQKEIEVAPDALNLARGREAFRAAAWRAEREHPAIWGQTNKLQVEHLDRSDDLRAAKARLIEGEIVDKSAETVDK